MKTNQLFFLKIIFSLLFMPYTGINLLAQTIENGNFENWDSVNYNEIYNQTSNYNSVIKFKQPNVIPIPNPNGGKPPHIGVRIKTTINGNDTIIGYVTDATDVKQFPNLIRGGCSCTNSTVWTGNFGTSISYKYSTRGNDSAYLWTVYFRNGGFIMARDSFALPKTNGKISRKLSSGPFFDKSNMPDSFIVYLSSSLHYRPENIDSSSELEVYDIGVGPNTLACKYSFPTAMWFGFSTWFEDRTYFNLPGWTQTKGFGSISHNSYLGNGALALSGRKNESGAFEGFEIRNYQSREDGSLFGGAAYTNTTDTLFGYYSYKAINIAASKIRLMLYKQGSLIFETYKDFFPPFSPYQYFQIPFHSDIQPDTLRIEISSMGSLNNKSGDTLFIDELQLASSKLLTTGISAYYASSNSPFQWYPNPASDFLQLGTNNLHSSIQKIQVQDVQGKILEELAITVELIPRVEVSSYCKGVYFIHTYLLDGRVFTNRVVKE